MLAELGNNCRIEQVTSKDEDGPQAEVFSVTEKLSPSYFTGGDYTHHHSLDNHYLRLTPLSNEERPSVVMEATKLQPHS